MKVTEKPQFEGTDHKQIYRFVERNGTADLEMARDSVGLDIERFYDVVSDLESSGYLEEREGTLRIALDAGTEETYSNGRLEYSVRPARQQDFPEIIKVIRHITDEETYVMAESVAEQLLYDDAVIRHNDAQSRVFFVAVCDDTVVGWTHLDTSPIRKLRHTAQQTIGVLEGYRGHGIGGRLMQRGLDWAVANDYRKVYNSLPATNTDALGFLEAHGWETEAIRRDHYQIDDGFVDEVMMAVQPADTTES